MKYPQPNYLLNETRNLHSNRIVGHCRNLPFQIDRWTFLEFTHVSYIVQYYTENHPIKKLSCQTKYDYSKFVAQFLLYMQPIWHSSRTNSAVIYDEHNKFHSNVMAQYVCVRWLVVLLHPIHKMPLFNFALRNCMTQIYLSWFWFYFIYSMLFIVSCFHCVCVCAVWTCFISELSWVDNCQLINHFSLTL